MVGTFASSCSSSQGSAKQGAEKKDRDEGDAIKETDGRSIRKVEKETWQERDSDPFKYDTVLQESERLELRIHYSGGCEDHRFALWAAPGVQKSDPPQQDLFLVHDANGDACRSLIKDTLLFDLSEFDPPMILHLEDRKEPVRYAP